MTEGACPLRLSMPGHNLKINAIEHSLLFRGVDLVIGCLGAGRQPPGTFRMKIPSDYASRRNKCILLAVFEV